MEEDDDDEHSKKMLNPNWIEKKYFDYREYSEDPDINEILELEYKINELKNVHKNVKIYFFYVGVLYGKEQIHLKEFLKKAFR